MADLYIADPMHTKGKWFNSVEDHDVEEFFELLKSELDIEEPVILDHEGFFGVKAASLGIANSVRLANIFDDARDKQALGIYITDVIGEGQIRSHQALYDEVSTDFVRDFEESFRGKWPDRADYAYNWHSEVGNTEDNSLVNYVDWDAVARDMVDHTTFVEHKGETYVFEIF